MGRDIIVVGAGGFGREVVDVIQAINAVADHPIWTLNGVVDDSPSEANLQRLADRSIEHIGTIGNLLATAARPDFVIAIGNPRVRQTLASGLETKGFAAATLVHPSATLGSRVTLGSGSVICAGVRVTTNVRIGRHAHVNINATIGHDTNLGDYVSVNPLASISGDCNIASGATIGVGASVLNGLTVGMNSIIGGGACAIRNIEAGATVVGVPAAPLKKTR